MTNDLTAHDKQVTSPWLLAARPVLALLALILALAGQVLLERAVVSWGVVLLLAGAFLAVIVYPARLTEPSTTAGGRRWAAVILVALLTALAAGLRLYRIQEIPPGLWLDETDLARSAIEILKGDRPPLFGVGHIEVPNLYRYYLAGYYWLLGAGYLTVKLPAIMAGTLATPVIYVLGRRFLRMELALAVAFLWATSRWSLNISRWGHVATLVPLLACLALWLVWRGLERGRWREWVTAGVVLALSQYTYQSARVIPLLAVLFILFWLLRNRGWLKRHWPKLVAAALLFLVLYGPLAATYLRDPLLFAERARGISLFNPLYTPTLDPPWLQDLPRPLGLLLDNGLKYLKAFNYQGDLNPRHNLVGAPALDLVTAALFVVGLAYALWRWRQPAAFLLLTWCGAILAGGLLTQGAPNTFRIYGLVPAVLLLVGLVLEAAWQSWERSWALTAGAWWPVGRWLLGGLTVLALARAADANVRTFFLEQAEQPGAWKDFNVASTRVGLALHELEGDWAVYLDRRFYGWSPIDVINPDLAYERLMLPRHVLTPPAVAEGHGVALALGNYSSGAVPFLRARYPHGQAQVIRNELGELLGTVFLIPAEDLDRGLRVAYGGAGQETGWNRGQDGGAGQETGRNGKGGAAWSGQVAALRPENAEGAPAGLAPPYAVHWWGGLRLDRAGAYHFRVRSTNPSTLTIAGQQAIADGEAAELWLPAGLLSLRLERAIDDPTDDQLALEWQPPDVTEWSRLPADRLYPIPVEDAGLLALYYEGDRFSGEPLAVYFDPLLLADNIGNQATYAQRWLGQIDITEPGTLRFATHSDDGSRLYLDETLLVDNWDLHGARQVEAQIDLAARPHPIELRYFDRGGGYWFAALWQPEASSGWQPLVAAPLHWDSAAVQTALAPEPPPSPAAIPIYAGATRAGEVPVARVVQSDQRWPAPQRDENFQRRLLKVKDDVFDRGIGVYSPSELAFALDGRFSRLQGAVGIDGDTAGDSVAAFQVVADGQIIWDSGPRWVYEPALPFDLDVAGVQELRLLVVDEGFGEGRADAVDWVELRLD